MGLLDLVVWICFLSCLNELRVALIYCKSYKLVVSTPKVFLGGVGVWVGFWGPMGSSLFHAHRMRATFPLTSERCGVIWDARAHPPSPNVCLFVCCCVESELCRKSASSFCSKRTFLNLASKDWGEQPGPGPGLHDHKL